MKHIALMIFSLLVVSGAHAGPNSELLQAHTWQAFISAEPLYRDRRILEIEFRDGKYYLTSTCLFNELGFGDNVTVQIVSDVTFNETSFTIPVSDQKSATNNMGKVCSAFVDAGTKAYQPLFGDREMVMTRRVFKIK